MRPIKMMFLIAQYIKFLFAESATLAIAGEALFADRTACVVKLCNAFCYTAVHMKCLSVLGLDDVS